MTENKYIQVEYDNEKHEDVNKPSIVVFPQNFPKVEELGNNKWGLFTNKDRKVKDDKMLVGENQKILYESRSRTQNNVSDYVIGVYNKKAKTLRFVDIDSIFSMNQKIRRVEANAIKKTNVETNTKPNYLENKTLLVNAFGTSKAKSKIQSMRSNIIEEQHISSSDAMKKILEENALIQEQYIRHNADDQLEVKIENMREILPAFDLDTKDVSSIFNQDTIMSDYDISANIDIKPYSKYYKCTDSLEEDKSEYNEFTYSLLKYISNLKDKNTFNRKLRLGLLIDHMINFHSMSKVIKQNLADVSRNSNIPLYFLNYLIETFTEVTPNQFDSVQYVKSPRLQLKLIFYIIVSSLIAFEYSLNIVPLAKAMKIEFKQMSQYCRELGCSVEEKKIKDDIITATLKAPLTIRTDKYVKK